MNFPKQIFKAYDIRGLVDGELSEEFAYALGQAFVEFLQLHGFDPVDKLLVVGRDMRATSLSFQQALIRGVNDSGVNVVDIGLATTPLFNFACAHYVAHVAGIMVTASHNPAEYNGFKMTLSDGLPVGKNNGMDEVRDLTEKYLNNPLMEKLSGTITQFNPSADYFAKLFSLASPESINPLKVVIDAGNGMAQVTIPAVLKHLPVQVEYLYLEPDGRFPNHEANPLKTDTLRDLQAKVLESGADLGFALDGDADRLGLVDEEGEVVEASFVGALIGLEILKENPGALMLYDLRSSMIVPEVWAAAGAKTAKSVVGHALIKKQMKEQSATFASELSLHLYFHSMYDVESTDLALLYILRLLSQSNKKLSELIAPLKKYFHSGESNYKVSDPAAVMARLENEYKNFAKEISHLDGLWLGFDWGWFNVRASNTEPVLRLNLEAHTRELMDEKLREVKALIECHSERM
ncbi:MAG: hypothetical protein A2261_02995 [Candidatus Magasanikbacteria bacterium RIFOXYA2_FULL_44_8]|uniref:Phosphomannomutase/phosphoglucomutase n=1 Tax=Candidatus Magasanikbacteria bacterium RIFOXYA2_FULL_44_8 TaxID=1798696 RepID=A0A1F6NLE1_9BACT|nr:MAG: hypothetical protein A2261_02995 [Candidatus Magasanikbacteria bacterium RIFOXYA2_FULL_44_8]